MSAPWLALILGLMTGGVGGFGVGCYMVFRDFGDVIDAGRIAIFEAAHDAAWARGAQAARDARRAAL